MLRSQPGVNNLLAIHFVRIGLLGHIGRFTAADRQQYAHGRRVVCRTSRGLEIGEVLGMADEFSSDSVADGTLLRSVTPEDELLLARIEKHQEQAYAECVSLLTEREINATLMDVEHLFDGQSLYFYFLGEVTPEIESITRDLSEAYESKVQFRQFADAVSRGCGPDCGTESASGCGTGCGSCSIASACHSS
ncbi:MAG: PSP1 C-terminal domain-containing protein [Pirellulaceae bacterium]|nr:PSP1 C-terminal domain-containing protein [Pirellulaceae bacterium]